jgi:serine/threonine-protein kinase
VTTQPTQLAQRARSVISRALSVELGKLEGKRTNAWLVMSLVICALSLVLILRAGVGASGWFTLGVGAICVVWFGAVRVLLSRGVWSPVMAIGTMIVETTAPWVLYAGLAVFGDAANAYRDWGPVFFYCGCQAIAVLKLNPRYPVVMAVLSSLQYLVVTHLLVAPSLAENGLPPLTAVSDFVRVGLFCGSGSVVAWVTSAVRDAVGGVVATVRSTDLFGKYRLEREVAAGGMGAVWAATYCPEGGFERPAAVKLVHPHLAKNAAFVDAFRREAELGARLVHSHIVQTFDFGVVDDRYFLAMEFVDGPTLRDVLVRMSETKAEMPPVVAGAIARGILAGLGFAHGGARDAGGQLLRVIHRDLAPSNILIARGGSVKITDFGIARALRHHQREETQTVAGHFDHMAPEQANAAPLDERTDLFCVGILLWEMLTGRALFKRNNEPATLLAVSYGEIPVPSSLNPNLAPWDALLRRALDRDPERRFQTADDMADAVGNLDGEAGEEVIARFIAPLLQPPMTSSRPLRPTPLPPPQIAPGDPTSEWDDAATSAPVLR